MGAGGNQGQDHGSSHGDDSLLIEPGAVPGLRNAFADALAKVDKQIALADAGLRVTGWAGDPVSKHATDTFNQRALDDSGSALGMLRAYREQLSNAVQNLDLTAQQYHLTEQDNSITVGAQEGGNG